MKRVRVLLMMAALSWIFAPLYAQDKSNADTKSAGTSLKVQVTIAELEGEKKVVSLPYTYFLRAGEGGAGSPWAKLRMGSRIPIWVGKDDGMQYIDVGTSIDARAVGIDGGRFEISMVVERSWVEGDVLVPMGKSTAQTGDSHAGPFREPIIRQFKTDLSLTMRDGQTTQSTLAADPLSGKLLSITVSVNAVK